MSSLQRLLWCSTVQIGNDSFIQTSLVASLEARLGLEESGFPLQESTPGVSLTYFLRVLAAEWLGRPTEVSRTISLKSKKT